MKAITVKQPWASLICSGLKNIENRTWKTKFSGRVLIHAGVKPVKFSGLSEILTHEQYLSLKGNYQPFMFNVNGYIIGSVEIVDCVINHPSIWAEKTEPKYLTTEKGRELQVKPIYNWVLTNPIMFDKPIPAKGKLSFWDYPNILAEPEEENGELFCHCQLGVDEKIQVRGDSRFGYYCHYCGGKWYK